MKRIIYICLLAFLFAACGNNTSEVDKIEVDIPAALNDNADAKELIEDMTDAVNACRENMAIGAKFVLEQEKSGSDSLTAKQGFKAGMFAAKMMLSAKKIEKIRAKAQELKPELSETDWLVLETKLDELETSVGDLEPADLGLSEEDMAKMDAEKESQPVRQEESIAALDEVAPSQEDLESGMALRKLEEEIMQEANANNNTQNTEAESGAGWMSIVFLLLVIVLVIIGVRRSIRVYKRKFRNASDTFSAAKNLINKNN